MLSKQAHLIPTTTTVKGEGVAKLSADDDEEIVVLLVVVHGGSRVD